MIDVGTKPTQLQRKKEGKVPSQGTQATLIIDHDFLIWFEFANLEIELSSLLYISPNENESLIYFLFSYPVILVPIL